MDTPEQPSSFGAVLRRYRTERGLAQEELAERAGLSVQAVSALERGLSQWPYRETVARLGAALGLTPAEQRSLEATARRPPRRSAPPLEPGRAAGAGAHPPVEAAPVALPLPLTALLGRETELERIGTVLTRPGGRLLTVTGPGGIGKTRLALEAARRLDRAAADRAVFIELAPLQDEMLLPAALAQALGVRAATGRTLGDAIAEVLARRSTLLVLDNCEHLPAVALTVRDLLAACPRLRVLATSRTPLHLRGEQLLPLAPLALPTARETSVAAITASPAVALFAERAQAVDPAFVLTPANAAAVATICRRLDGLPLALELAAAHCRALPPHALLGRLALRLPLLSGGPRDLPARQRTLRAAITWSYELLPPDVQRVFRCLAVCAGGCTLAAAEAICALDAGDEDTLVGQVDTLVGASLLVPADRGAEEPRFAMLETIREYGLERLAESGEGAVVRGRHLACFLALAEQAALAMHGPEQVAWQERLEAEHDNLRAALAWSLAGGDGPAVAAATEPAAGSSGLRLATALAEFWWTRGYMGEGRRWLAQALAAAPEVAPALRARALLGAGLLGFWQGDLAHAARLCGEGLALARTAEDRPVTAELLNNLGWVLQFQGEHHSAVALHEESLALYRALGDTPGSVRALVHLGFGLLQLRTFARAEQLLREAGALAEAVDDTYGMGAAAQMLGFSAAAQGDYPLAEARLHNALAVARRLGFTWGQAATACGLGEVACRQGRLDEAATYVGEGLALFREMDQQWGIAWALEGLAATKVAAHAALEGARLLGVAARLREAAATQMRAPGSSYDWSTEAACAALGDAGMAQALAEGRAMSLPHVLDAVLGQTVQGSLPLSRL